MRPAVATPEDALTRKVSALSRPDCYPERPRAIEPIETHMSWVFLTDRHAYKLKKAIRTPYLDFSELAARLRYCEAEVVLNRPLAAGVYLGVVPLVRTANGELRIAGKGEVVDWLVKSRRLPAERMLDHAVREGSVTEAAVRQVIARLVAFYAAATPIPLAPEAYVAQLRSTVIENVQVLRWRSFGLPQGPVETVGARLLRCLDTEPAMLAERAEHGRIVDGHGDLRPEHIVLEAEPKIIDRIEFNDALRRLDPVDEIAYLALECEQLGATRLGALAMRSFLELTGDPVPDRLIAFYKALRASLRAKLAAWHVSEPRHHGPEHWLAQARSYLELAARYATSAA